MELKRKTKARTKKAFFATGKSDKQDDNTKDPIKFIKWSQVTEAKVVFLGVLEAEAWFQWIKEVSEK